MPSGASIYPVQFQDDNELGMFKEEEEDLCNCFMATEREEECNTVRGRWRCEPDGVGT
jgi:hypothetical protein